MADSKRHGAQLGPRRSHGAILTKLSKFNRGEAYYFLLRKQDYPCIDADGSSAPLRTGDDADALASRIASHAARRHAEHARENRFRRLQKSLRPGIPPAL